MESITLNRLMQAVEIDEKIEFKTSMVPVKFKEEYFSI